MLVQPGPEPGLEIFVQSEPEPGTPVDLCCFLMVTGVVEVVDAGF